MNKDEPMSEQASTSSRIESGQREAAMDEGLFAWLQVLGSWILFANTWLVLAWLICIDEYLHDLRPCSQSGLC